MRDRRIQAGHTKPDSDRYVLTKLRDGEALSAWHTRWLRQRYSAATIAAVACGAMTVADVEAGKPAPPLCTACNERTAMHRDADLCLVCAGNDSDRQDMLREYAGVVGDDEQGGK